MNEIHITNGEQIDALSDEEAIALEYSLPGATNYGDERMTGHMAKLLLKCYLREQKFILEELAKDPKDRLDPLPDNLDDLYVELG